MRPNKEHVVFGFTGGIGSGKSEILRYIGSHYDCRIIKADEVGRDLMRPGRSVYRALTEAFGNEILGEHGEIDRPRFTERLFSDPEALQLANSIEHPIIKRSILSRISRTKCRHIFLEAALLWEGGLVPLCDQVIVVFADQETRIERLSASRGYPREKAVSMIKRQLSEEEFLRLADHVIDTCGTLEDTYEKTRRLMAELKVPVRS